MFPTHVWMNRDPVYREIINMPVGEREKLFAAIARRGFEKDLYTYEEVFEDLAGSPFTIREAAEYLEVSEITIRRWVKAGRLKDRRIGKRIVFDPSVLREKKGALRLRRPDSGRLHSLNLYPAPGTVRIYSGSAGFFSILCLRCCM